jgi:glycogen synthase
LRIAFITYEFPPDTGKGGIGTYTAQVAALMAQAGNDIHVFCGSPYRSGRHTQDGYTLHITGSSNGNEFREQVVATFAAEHGLLSFDLVESPEINSNAAGIKKVFPAIPLVVRLHAPGYLVESLKKRYYPFSAKLRYVLGALRRRLDAGYWRNYDYKKDTDYQFFLMADAVSAPSEAMKKWVMQYWKIPAVNVSIIPNPFTAPAALLQLPVAQKATHKEVLFFGRLNVLKGLVNATLAMKKILNEFEDWHFTVIGNDGPGPVHGSSMKEWMQQQLQEVKEQVSFKSGFSYEELPAAIGNADIVLLPSLFESFSYTCAEAMAAGKAVVGSRDTGMSFMRHNETGLLINPLKPTEIYVAVKSLITDDNKRKTLAQNARADIQKLFADGQVVTGFSAFYKNILAENSRISFS